MAIITANVPVGVGTTLGILSRKDNCGAGDGVVLVVVLEVVLWVVVVVVVVDVVGETFVILVFGFSRFFFLVLVLDFDFFAASSSSNLV